MPTKKKGKGKLKKLLRGVGNALAGAAGQRNKPRKPKDPINKGVSPESQGPPSAETGMYPPQEEARAENKTTARTKIQRLRARDKEIAKDKRAGKLLTNAGGRQAKQERQSVKNYNAAYSKKNKSAPKTSGDTYGYRAPKSTANQQAGCAENFG